jgi:hypothetical protein
VMVYRAKRMTVWEDQSGGSFGLLVWMVMQ